MTFVHPNVIMVYPFQNANNFSSFPVDVTKIQCYVSQKYRQISYQQKEIIKDNRTLLRRLLRTTGNENINILTDISFVIGFSGIHIQQIMNNLQHLFVSDDVYNFIEIWDRRHAYKI